MPGKVKSAFLGVKRIGATFTRRRIATPGLFIAGRWFAATQSFPAGVKTKGSPRITRADMGSPATKPFSLGSFHRRPSAISLRA